MIVGRPFLSSALKSHPTQAQGRKALLRGGACLRELCQQKPPRRARPRETGQDTVLHVKADPFPSKMAAERNSSGRQTPFKGRSRTPQTV